MADRVAAVRHRRRLDGSPARTGIAARMTRTFMLVAGLLILLVGLVLSWASYSAVLEQVQVRQQKTAREAVLVTTTYLSRAQDTLNTYGQLGSLQGLLLRSLRVQQEELTRMMVEHGGMFQSLTLVDAAGNELARVVATVPEATKESDFVSVGIQDLGSVADSVAFTRAIAGEIYLADQIVDQQPGLAPAVTVAVPLRGRDRDGVLVAGVGVDGLWQAMSIVDMGRSGYAYIVNRETGELVTAQSSTAAGDPLTPENVSVVPMVRHVVAGEAALDTSGDVEPPENSWASTVDQYVGLARQEVIGAAEALPATNWALVAELPVNEAMASANAILYLLALLVVVGAVVAGGLGMLVPRRVVRPILALQAGANELAEGRLDHPIEIETGDELEDLAHSFNQMAVNLQASHRELEQWGRDLERRVADRTVELAEVTEQMRRRADQLQLSAEVAHAIASVRDLDALLPRVTRLIGERFGWYHVGIFLLEDALQPETTEAGSMRVGKSTYAILRAANSQGGQRMLAAGHKLKVGEVGIVGSVASSGQPRIALDVGQDAVYFDNPELPDTRSEMALPLQVGDRVIGVLDVQSTTAQAYDAQDVAMLSVLADQVAVAIENAMLFQQTQQALQEVRALHRRYVEHEWVRSTTAQGELAYEYRRGAGTPVVVDDWPPELRLALAENRVVARTAPPPSVPSGGGEGPDALTGTPGLLSPATEPGNGDGENPLDAFAAQAALAVPIRFRDQVIGVVDLQEVDEPRWWTDDEVVLVQAIADQVGLALENARLLADTQHRAEQLATLHRVGLDVTAALDLDGVLEALFQQISRVMDAESFYVALYDETTGTIDFPLMTGDEGRLAAPPRNIHKEPGITGEVLTTGTPLYVPDLLRRGSAPEAQEVAPDAGRPYRAISIGERTTRSYIGVPLVFRDQVFGVLSVQSYMPNAYRPEDVELLTTIATQASIAIQNARAYQRLVETAEQLREIDRLKTQFLANMSHELRTPLNSIIGFSRVMIKGIDGPLTDLQEADLNSIYASGQHLLGLINSILDMSKIEAGKMDLSFDEVSLYDIFNAVLGTARALVKDQPIDLVAEIPETLPTVWADAQRVRQVLLNLMSNAVKFTEKGRVTLRAWAGVDTSSIPTGARAGARFVTVSVQDTGIGMNREAQDRLFIPFQQVDASTTRRAGGTGLGLAISRSFVEMQGGRIWVESAPGKGSTFYFTLPIYQPPFPAAAETSSGTPETYSGTPETYSGTPEARAVVPGTSPAAPEPYSGAPDAHPVALPGAELPWDVRQDDSLVVAVPPLPPPPQAGTQPEGYLGRVSGPSEGDVDTLARAEAPEAHSASTMPPSASALLIPEQPGETDAASTPAHALAGGEATGAGAAKVVLVVDDDRGVVTLLKRYLETEGYQVVGVVESPEAIDVARRLAPQLAAITLDIVMPRMDGWQVLRALKGDPDTRHVPVILCSIVEGLEHGLKLGADMWLRKPVTRDEVLSAVRKVEVSSPKAGPATTPPFLRGERPPKL